MTLPGKASQRGRWASLPIPLLLTLIVGLRIADPRAVHESRTVMVLLNVFFTGLASLSVCVLTARSFRNNGQPGLLMFGCGSLFWGMTSLAAAVVVDRINPTITIHNLGIFGAAVCHLIGLHWQRRLFRPSLYLAVGYAGALVATALVVWAALAGWTPVFFVQGHGGTAVRWCVLLLAMVMFAGVAGQMLSRFRRGADVFYYWYGLGLALVATGLTGIMLLTVQGSILGWVNRLTQCLGSVYLLIAAVAAVRQTGGWGISLGEALEASEERFRLFVEHAPAASALFDNEMRYLAASARWREDYGLTGESIVGRSHYEIFPEIPQRWKEIHRRALAGAVERAEEDRFERVDGSVQWVRWEVRPWYLAKGVIGGIIIFSEDITDRKRTQDALRQSESRYRRLMQSIPIPLGVVKRTGEIVHFNDCFTRVFGYTPADIPTLEAWWRRAYPDPAYRVRVVENWRAKVRRSEETGTETPPEEFNVTCKDGTVRMVVISNLVIDDCILASFTDVTERKRAEASLRASEERFKLSMEATQDGLWDWNAQTDEVYYSPSYYRILGYEPGGFPNTLQAWKEMVHPEDLERTLKVNMDCVEGRTQSFAVEYRLKARSGEWRWILGRGKCLTRDSNGRATRLIGTHVDITERKRMEEELRRSKGELEDRVRERTSELQAAVEELRRSNEDLERFAHISSHDLQEPVRMVSIYTGLVGERYRDKLDAKAREYIDFAVEGAQRMSTLIKDLLAYSRVNTEGRNLVATDAGAVVQRTMANLQYRIKETGAEITCEHLPTVLADATQLSQVFQNLIENAIKYRRDDRPPKVHIHAEQKDGQWRFAVKDNGIGIDPKYYEQVFVAFKRLHADRGKYPGTGIGLAVVKRIVERHGGQIGVESAPGQGSTFWFTLPAKG